ncbi:hypothetical protein [Lichenicoccus roseus]|uniref:hypothetical protein n=1 Tax=Lichenicoccus roseus TaxID=2683649 RepID=UPI001F115F19|nr:hypothetical protein [Lichenicoccus roseus]
MQSVIGVMRCAANDGYDVTLGLLGQDALITRSRNTLLAHFMALRQATHILFVDGDISFQPALVRDLLAFGKPLCAATYPLKTHYWDEATRLRLERGEPPEAAGLRYVGELCMNAEAERDGAFATARYAGTGFMLIARAVIERMMQAYPETSYRSVHSYADQHPDSDLHPFALFECMIDPASRIYLSEDFAFCQRWRALGGQVWLETRSSLTHSGPADFVGQPARVFEASLTRPAGPEPAWSAVPAR